MNSQAAHSGELLFLTLLFGAVLLAWGAYEAHAFIVKVLFGEVLPEPDGLCRVLRELPDDEIGEWYIWIPPPEGTDAFVGKHSEVRISGVPISEWETIGALRFQ